MRGRTACALPAPSSSPNTPGLAGASRPTCMQQHNKVLFDSLPTVRHTLYHDMLISMHPQCMLQVTPGLAGASRPTCMQHTTMFFYSKPTVRHMLYQHASSQHAQLTPGLTGGSRPTCTQHTAIDVIQTCSEVDLLPMVSHMLNQHASSQHAQLE
jgi:hypothetical protein